MFIKAVDAFNTFIYEHFEPIKVYNEYPGHRQKVVFPHIVLLSVRNELQRFSQKLEEQFTDDDGHINQVYNTGQWEVQMDLHYFSKDGKREDEIKFLEKVNALFDVQISNDERISSNLTLSFGQKSYENLNISFLGFDLEQNSVKLQSGERRTIVHLLLDVPQLVTAKIPIVEDIQADYEIGEDVNA